MYQLDPKDYGRVRPLFGGLDHALAIDSILDGHTTGQVYADDVAAPRTALVGTLQGDLYLAGEAGDAATNRALGALITERIIPAARSLGVPGIALFYDAPAWEAAIDDVLPGLNPIQVGRRYYHFQEPRLDWRATVPPGRTLVRVDEGWLARRDLANVEQVVGWVDSFWHSHADFVQHSFGYCLLEGDAIASWCLGVFVSGQQVELGLATVPESRGQGYATAVAARCVAHCAEEGLTPHWHCWDDNVASWRIAEKVGFVDPQFYTVYFVDIRSSL
jgi:RimJ/RimL family protein N-acetyltransferase